jgi:hypothetical protein
MQGLGLPHYRLSLLASLSIRRWGDECVVHHALSNDTHRVSDAAGRILEALGTAPRLDVQDFVEFCALEVSTVEEALVTLSDLNFVVSC